MSMDSPHESVKDLAGEVWNKNRPLAIAVLVIAAVVAYVVYQRSQSSIVAPPSPTPTSPSGAGRITNITNITKTFMQPSPSPQGPYPVPMPPIPGPIPGPSPIAANPLIPYGQLPLGTQYVFGRTLVWQGVTYTIGPGAGGRLWGVPGTGFTLNQWNAVSMPPKVLLYAPQSAYH